jgi:hypothetical protein
MTTAGVVGFVLTLLFGGLGVAVIMRLWGRLGGVQFRPSDWHMRFWKEASPPIILIGPIDRALPETAGHAQCTFTVELFSNKDVDTVLHDIAAEFHLPGGDVCKVAVHDPPAHRDLTSLHLPARQQITREFWINVLASEVGREVMTKLPDTERVVFAARFPSGWPFRKQIHPPPEQGPWWRRMFGR